MVNLNAKSPNKRRKSIAAEPVSDTPKKAKINEPKTPNKNATPGKPNNKSPKQTPAKNVAAAAPVANGTPAAQKTPGKQPKTPQQNNKQTPAKLNGKSPAQNNKNAAKSPVKQEKSPVKREAEAAPNAASPAKKVKMFAGTAALEAPSSPKKQNTKAPNVKKQNQKKEKKTNQGGPVDAKKKKKGLVFAVITAVAEGKGETVVESIDKKIADIKSRKELTKTARRRLRLLQKWKQTAEGNPPQPQSKSAKTAERVKRDALKKNEPKTQQNQKGKQQPDKKQVKGKQQQVKKETAPKIVKKEEESDEEEDSDEEESDYEVEAEVKPEKVTKTKGFTGDSDESDEDDDEDDEDDDESGEEEEDEDEEAPAAPASKKGKKPEPKSQKPKQPNLQELKANNIVKNNQSRYVLFVGNLPFDATKEEISEHFSKTGKISHVRIPTDIKTQKPRGFAYVELENEESYQRGLSLHHTFLKGRRINVLYSEGGKKKSEDRKQQVKAKNFKLHAMRKDGQLAGSVKDSQKRSFRRNKGKQVNGGA